MWHIYSILFWHSISHSFWHILWDSIWHSIWIYLASLLTYFLAISVIYSDILSGILSGIYSAHCAPTLTVEVRQCPLRSGTHLAGGEKKTCNPPWNPTGIARHPKKQRAMTHDVDMGLGQKYRSYSHTQIDYNFAWGTWCSKPWVFFGGSKFWDNPLGGVLLGFGVWLQVRQGLGQDGFHWPDSSVDS